MTDKRTFYGTTWEVIKGQSIKFAIKRASTIWLIDTFGSNVNPQLISYL